MKARLHAVYKIICCLLYIGSVNKFCVVKYFTTFLFVFIHSIFTIFIIFRLSFVSNNNRTRFSLKILAIKCFCVSIYLYKHTYKNKRKVKKIFYVNTFRPWSNFIKASVEMLFNNLYL